MSNSCRAFFVLSSPEAQTSSRELTRAEQLVRTRRIQCLSLLRNNEQKREREGGKKEEEEEEGQDVGCRRRRRWSSGQPVTTKDVEM